MAQQKQDNPFFKAVSSGDVATMTQLFTPAALSMTDSDGKNALHFAAIEGRVEAIEWLIEKGFATDTLSKKGLTPFHFAVFKGQKTAAQLLHAAGCDTTLSDATGRTALHLACTSGNLDLVTWLVQEAGASVCDVNNDGMSAAHFAALGGSTPVLEWLAREGGLEMDGVTHAGTGCMHLAAMKGHLDALQWLANPSPHGGGLPVNASDLRKRTPLHLAVASSNGDAVRFLLDAGADPRSADAEGKTAVQLATGILASAASPLAERVRDLVNAAAAPPPPPPPPSAITPHVCAEVGLLVEEGEVPPGVGEPPAPKLPPPGMGLTPTRAFLRWEAPDCPPAGKPPTEYSLQVAPRMQARMGLGWVDAQLVVIGLGSSTGGGWGESTAPTTPHCFACVAGLTPNTAYSVRVRARNGMGWGSYSKAEDITTSKEGGKEGGGAAASPQEEGAATGEGGGAVEPLPPPAPAEPAPPPVVEATLTPRVVDAGAKGDVGGLEDAEGEGEDVRGVDDKGRGVLHHAGSGGALATLKWGLARGLPIEGKDKLGATPLLLAVVSGALPCVKALAAGGASLDACDLKGYAGVHYAAIKAGRLAIFRWLCEAGADVTLKNYKGQTARAIVEGKLSPPAPAAGAPLPPPLTKEEAAACTYMLSILANAEAVPSAPPSPLLVDSTRYSLLLSLPPAKWSPGCPAPFAYEVQYTRKSGMGLGISPFWSTLSDTLPTGFNVYAPEYLGAGQGGPAAGGVGVGVGEGGEAPPPPSTPTSSTGGPAKVGGPGLHTPVVIAINGLQPDSRYVAQVRARNARGWGPWSVRSADLSTRGSSDKHSPKAESMQAANAAQVAAGLLATELSTALASSGKSGGAPFRPPPTVYFKPSEVVADPEAAGVPLPQVTPTASAAADIDDDGTGGGVTRASTSSTPATTALSEYVDGEGGVGGGAEGQPSLRNPILTAAAEGRLLDLAGPDGGAAGTLVQDLRRRLLSVADKHHVLGPSGGGGGGGGRTPAALHAALAAWCAPTPDLPSPASVPDVLRVDGEGLVGTSLQNVLVDAAVACVMGGHTRSLHWLVGGSSDVTSPSPAAADSAVPAPLPPSEARALVLLDTSCKARDSDSRGLLHVASLGGHVGTLRFVLSGLASVEDEAACAVPLKVRMAQRAAGTVSASGASPVHLAAFGGDTDCLGWLLSLLVHAPGGPPLPTLTPSPSSWADARDTSHAWCPLHYAGAGGRPDAFLLLVKDAGVSPSTKDGAGRTAAHLGAGANSAALLAAVASVAPALLGEGDGGGLTPLHYAAASDAGLSAAYLLSQGVSPDARDCAGRTAADVAALVGGTAVSTLLSGWRGGVVTLPPQAVKATRTPCGGVLVSWLQGREGVLHVLCTSHAVDSPSRLALEVEAEACLGGTGVLLEGGASGGGGSTSTSTSSSPALQVALEWVVAKGGARDAAAVFFSAALPRPPATVSSPSCGCTLVPAIGPTDRRARIEVLSGTPPAGTPLLVRASFVAGGVVIAGSGAVRVR